MALNSRAKIAGIPCLLFFAAFWPAIASDISVSNSDALVDLIKVDPSLHVGSFSDTRRGCLDSILSNCIELEEPNIVRGIMALDVWLAFNLKDEYGLYDEDYDTPLKRKSFLNTDDYKSCFNTMKAVRDSILQGRVFFIKATGSFGNYSLSRHGLSFVFESSNYPIKSAISFIYLPTILSRFIIDSEAGSSGPTPRDSSASFFIKLDENKGALIENNNDNVALYILFKISGTTKRTYRDFDERGNWHSRPEIVITTSPISILIGNIETHECYIENKFR